MEVSNKGNVSQARAGGAVVHAVKYDGPPDAAPARPAPSPSGGVVHVVQSCIIFPTSPSIEGGVGKVFAADEPLGYPGTTISTASDGPPIISYGGAAKAAPPPAHPSSDTARPPSNDLTINVARHPGATLVRRVSDLSSSGGASAAAFPSLSRKFSFGEPPQQIDGPSTTANAKTGTEFYNPDVVNKATVAKGKNNTAPPAKRPRNTKSDAVPKGVSQVGNTWRVQLYFSCKATKRVIGRFHTLEDAAIAVKAARDKLKELRTNPVTGQFKSLKTKDAVEAVVKVVKRAASDAVLVLHKNNNKAAAESEKETPPQDQSSSEQPLRTILPPGISKLPSGKYHAQVYFIGENRSIGTFDTLQDAICANDAAQVKLRAFLLKQSYTGGGTKVSPEEAEDAVVEATIAVHDAVIALNRGSQGKIIGGNRTPKRSIGEAGSPHLPLKKRALRRASVWM